jgi:putative two-component system response regulator
VTQQVLFVDDDPHILTAFRRTLSSYRNAWTMSFYQSPWEAWERITSERVDIVVSDLNMPGMDGLELLARMQDSAVARDVPLILVTGQGDHELRNRAIESGATDLLEKPVDSADLVARIRNGLRLKACQDQLKGQNEILEREVRRRTAELEQSRFEVIRRLAKAAEFRDQETGNHVIRVGMTSRLVGEYLTLDPDYIETLALTAPLHDLGKIGVPDSILLKPGQLDERERDLMRRHCVIGARILRGEESGTLSNMVRPSDEWFRSVTDPEDRSVLCVAAAIALTHHEKWDGSGYPQGLAGVAIPLEGRIVAIADVFDALMSRRPYKRSFTEDETLELLARDVGKHFDPDVYRAFCLAFEQIKAVRKEFADHEPDLAEAIQ